MKISKFTQVMNASELAFQVATPDYYPTLLLTQQRMLQRIKKKQK